MSFIDLTPTQTIVSMGWIGNTGLYISGVTGSTQTIDRGGFRWEIVYTYNNMHHDKRATIMSLVASLRAQANRLRVPVYDNPKQGAYGGTPLVDGAAQTGSTIDIKGCDNNVTDWITPGDYLGITVNGEVELKMCTAPGSSNGSGLITGLAFEPRLRASPSDSAAIIVEDGVLGKPTGVFIVKNPTLGWSSRPFQSGSDLSSLTLSMIEDLFASQS